MATISGFDRDISVSGTVKIERKMNEIGEPRVKCPWPLVAKRCDGPGLQAVYVAFVWFGSSILN